MTHVICRTCEKISDIPVVDSNNFVGWEVFKNFDLPEGWVYLMTSKNADGPSGSFMCYECWRPFPCGD